MERPKKNYEYAIFLTVVCGVLFPISLIWFYSTVKSVIEDLDLIYSFTKWIQFMASGFLLAFSIEIIYRAITNKRI